MKDTRIFSKKDLTNILPQKSTAQMLDGVEFNPDFTHKIMSYKKIEPNGIWLRGHFPDKPIFPGHCLMECAFLTALALVKITMPEVKGIPMIVRVGKTSFRLPALVGDTIEFYLTLMGNLDVKISSVV